MGGNIYSKKATALMRKIREKEFNMEKEENVIVEENERKEVNILVPTLIESKTQNGTIMNTETTVQDKKQVFNIENGECDVKLNDIVGNEIVVKDVFIKRIVRKLRDDEIEIDEETGEIKSDIKYSVVTILIDEQGLKYVTASKTFAYAIQNLVDTFGIEEIQKGIKIRIIKKQVSGSNNKALSFELV